MIIKKKNNKKILELLLFRWKLLAYFGAMEIIHKEQIKLSKQQNIQIPLATKILESTPTEQINLIKQIITTIIPGAQFINTPYEAPTQLQPDDFVELYINHQNICIEHVRKLVKIGV